MLTRLNIPCGMQVNTTAVVFATKAMNHVEGGWPKEVDYTEAEHVIRYRKKVKQAAAMQTMETSMEFAACRLIKFVFHFFFHGSCLHILLLHYSCKSKGSCNGNSRPHQCFTQRIMNGTAYSLAVCLLACCNNNSCST